MNPNSCRTTSLRTSLPDEARMQRREVIETARDLRSEEGENREYDRGLVEMSTRLLGLPLDQADVVGAAIGVKDFERFDY